MQTEHEAINSTFEVFGFSRVYPQMEAIARLIFKTLEPGSCRDSSVAPQVTNLTAVVDTGLIEAVVPQ